MNTLVKPLIDIVSEFVRLEQVLKRINILWTEL